MREKHLQGLLPSTLVVFARGAFHFKERDKLMEPAGAGASFYGKDAHTMSEI